MTHSLQPSRPERQRQQHAQEQGERQLPPVTTAARLPISMSVMPRAEEVAETLADDPGPTPNDQTGLARTRATYQAHTVGPSEAP